MVLITTILWSLLPETCKCKPLKKPYEETQLRHISVILIDVYWTGFINVKLTWLCLMGKNTALKKIKVKFERIEKYYEYTFLRFVLQ
ncbi:unnamed protein product [Paramecium octaurelia]|uniref:Secreted protein n=1 Tax=Paramecium octaurelia TaxID=43137 RepID=A0A8S1YRN3_PAROT|nr:unnamed protein product [Paramecium octaurelia]